MLNTALAFFIFNRPELTRKVFAEIRRAQPRRLFVIADGPRFEAEAARCAEARAVLDHLDWDCELSINFAETNLGCKQRVSSGISWVFESCDEAIFLEDDCVPHQTFFRYCEELLERYRNNERIMTINGSSFHGNQKPTPESYYFSALVQPWGWASWRRAWNCFDLEMRRWPELRKTSWLNDILGSDRAVTYWRMLFDRTFAGQIDTWDFQWVFSWWVHEGLAIVPATNLISNIGFGDDATHTKSPPKSLAYLPFGEMQFPLRHPADISRNMETDLFIFSQICPWAFPQAGVKAWLRRRVPRVLRAIGKAS